MNERAECIELSSPQVAALHDRLFTAPGWPTAELPPPTGNVWFWVQANHRFNSLLWDEEDLARRMAVADAEIAANKRAIDGHNQARNDATERVDEILLVALGLVDAASALVEKAVPQPLAAERDLALSKAQDILLSLGITAIADMGTSPDDWNTMRRAGDRDALRVRVVAYANSIDTAISIAGAGATPWLYGDRLRMVGIKLYADGALGSRGACLKKPYADAPGQTGLCFLDDTKLRNIMSRAAMNNLQVATHAIGDAADAQVLGAIEELALTYKGDRRWRIEHAQIVDPADLPRFGRLGIIASMQPVHQTRDSTRHG